MPFNNFETRHFSPEEQKNIKMIIDNLQKALAPKLANLSPEERKQYGSVNEQNKLIINKVKQYRDTQSELCSPDVDWKEFDKDFESREFIQSIIQQLENVMNGIGNARILHDWDNYQAALTDYNYTKYKVGTTATGYETKSNDLGQFFSGRGGNGTATPDNNSDIEG